MMEKSTLVQQLEEDQFGIDTVIKGPFGVKRCEQFIAKFYRLLLIFLLLVVYADHTASGRYVHVVIANKVASDSDRFSAERSDSLSSL